MTAGWSLGGGKFKFTEEECGLMQTGRMDGDFCGDFEVFGAILRISVWRGKEFCLNLAMETAARSRRRRDAGRFDNITKGVYR